MARIEFPEEIRQRVEAIGTPDLVIGIAGAIHPDDLRARIEHCLPSLPVAPAKTAVVYAGGGNPAAAPENSTHYLAYPSPQHDPSLGPWGEIAAAQRSALALAALLQPRACAILHPDLLALSVPALGAIALPVLDGKADLVTPIYPETRYDGLINKSILAPLSRALFGRRVRTPLALDFAASARVLPALNGAGPARSHPGPLLWPSHIAAFESGETCQAHIDAAHVLRTDNLDLSAVLTQLVGALFGEVEAYAAQWQRVRGSQATMACEAVVPATGQTAADIADDARPLDTKPLIDSFVLGSRNLEEVWRLVLPPLTLFDLQRLARLTPEEFRLPDELWARIVYDFALAWRLRRIGRNHLLGALTPLYLGWVASYAQEVSGLTTPQADQRIQLLAQVFEVNKPYFVSRWRWPDRAS
jgi:hypothetical protein